MCDGSLHSRESVWCGGSIGRRWLRVCCSNGVAFSHRCGRHIGNVVEQFAPESEQPLDECFVEDPRANLRAIACSP